MKNKIVALSFILLLTISLTASVSLTQAATTSSASSTAHWITAYTIEDASSDQLLVRYDSTTNPVTNQTLAPVLPGTDIRVTFTVDVLALGGESLKLSTGLQKSTSHANGFWEVVSEDYDMGSSYNPASASTTIKWSEGTFDMVLYGRVPNTASSTAKTINVVTLGSASGGTALDQITVKSTNSALAKFDTLYADHQDTLDGFKSSGVDAVFIAQYENMLGVAKDLADAGDSTNAIAILDGLDQAGAPPSSTMQALFLPLVGVTAVIAALFAVLFLRTRGKMSYFRLVVEDQIKDLEGLTLRASKIDRAMSANLDSVKDRLKRLVGM
jgi:hypothetical protein